jgi:hypothetical protein
MIKLDRAPHENTWKRLPVYATSGKLEFVCSVCVVYVCRPIPRTIFFSLFILKIMLFHSIYYYILRGPW